MSTDVDLPAAPTEPGIYLGVPTKVYHADRNSLSSSQARRLLKTCPAQFKYELDNPRTGSTDYFDLGRVVHGLLFGEGDEIRIFDYENWRPKEAQTKRKEAWDAGAVPMLGHEFAQAYEMVLSARNNPVVAALLSSGRAEASMYARDPETGIMLRARPDWMDETGQRLILDDGKTTESSDPDEFPWEAFKYGYAEQAAWYIRVAQLLGLDPDPAFLFIVISKVPPYLVSVIELTPTAIAYGHRRNRRAIDLYARCVETDEWPNWGDDVHPVDLPARAYYLEDNQ